MPSTTGGGPTFVPGPYGYLSGYPWGYGGYFGNYGAGFGNYGAGYFGADYGWGYLGLGYGLTGFGFSSLSGIYDPFEPSGSNLAFSDSGSTSASSSQRGETGALRLKVKPAQASVYVDGEHVGLVDQYDGIFQKLHLSSGNHRVELRAPGYETLIFNVRIEPDHTETYRGALEKQ